MCIQVVTNYQYIISFNSQNWSVFSMILEAFASTAHPTERWPFQFIRLYTYFYNLLTWKTTLSYQITSMAFERPDTILIFCPLSLPFDHPLLGTLVNLLSLPSISQKHLTGYDTSHCFLNYLPSVYICMFYIIFGNKTVRPWSFCSL